MGDVATAAGCSRATLYRYFADRHELHVAYVHREARRVGGLVAADAARVEDPEQRLVAAVLSALRHVREAPELAAWFADGDVAATAELAQASPVIEALGRGVVDGPARGPLGGAGGALAAHRARPGRGRGARDGRALRRARARRPRQRMISTFTFAGLASTMPKGLIARTLILCLPTLSFFLYGEAQGYHFLPSSWHWNVEPGEVGGELHLDLRVGPLALRPLGDRGVRRRAGGLGQRRLRGRRPG